MKKYRVDVQKRVFVTGYVEVDAKDERAAFRDVARQIDEGLLQTTRAVWGDDTEYEDDSFCVTGDVLEAPKEGG